MFETAAGQAVQRCSLTRSHATCGLGPVAGTYVQDLLPDIVAGTCGQEFAWLIDVWVVGWVAGWLGGWVRG